MSTTTAQEITEASTSKTIDVDGTKIHYNEAGEGVPLVLIHGAGPGASGWSNYNRNVAELAKSFRVIVPDLPGFGKSDTKPAGSAMPEWYATKMGQLLDALDIESAHFVGNSLGGMITLRLAMDRPEKVKRMVLMGTAGSLPAFSNYPTPAIMELLFFYDGEGPSKERLRRFADQFVFDPSQITDDLLQNRMDTAMQDHIVENPPMRPVPGTKFEEVWRDARLTMLQHDTMLMWGREDRVNPMDMAFVLLKQIPKARLYVLPQCGHWAQWEHAEEFNDTVQLFFSKGN